MLAAMIAEAQHVAVASALPMAGISLHDAREQRTGQRLGAEPRDPTIR